MMQINARIPVAKDVKVAGKVSQINDLPVLARKFGSCENSANKWLTRNESAVKCAAPGQGVLLATS